MEAKLAKPKTPIERRHFRPDIQGLRAVAVISVMCFHIWPGYLTGGYIGVDVFFVISGYLITGLLVRELDKTGRISIATFYGRRIKRLVPCATFVLVTTAMLSTIFLPATQWRSTAHGIAASAIYVENWDLIHKSANYLNAFFAPTPLQHFWSLSVEGQFYIFWPLVILFIDRFAPKNRDKTQQRLANFSAITLLLFACSLVLCFHASVPAYFSTLTRLWELSLGGSLIFLDRVFARVSLGNATLFGSLGLFAILIGDIFLSSQTLFPGYAALLPTLGAALVILAGQREEQTWPSRVLAIRLLRYVGDISYSMYLWHWPILIFYKEIWSPDINLPTGVAIFLLCTMLSHATWRFVERPFYDSRAAGRLFTANAFKLAAACTALSIASAAGLFSYLSFLQRADSHPVLDADEYPGPRALARDFNNEYIRRPFIPSVLNARYDQAESEKDGCQATYSQIEPKRCVYSVADSKLTVALVGDSHAEQWLPALSAIAEKRGLAITVYAKAHCAFADTDVFLLEEGRTYKECRIWSQRLLQELIETRPSIFITSQINGYQVTGSSNENESIQKMTSGFASMWRELADGGTRIFAIRDTPFMPFDVPDCLARRGATGERCSALRPAVLKPIDPLVQAAHTVNATVIDMNDEICAVDRCQAVVGNILVYQDSNHLTATYSRALSGELDRKIQWGSAEN